MNIWTKAALAVFALSNIKVWPFMFHVRFYYYVLVNMYIKRRVKASSVYKTVTYTTHTPFLEMDFNLHKSNSTYFSDLDMSRTVLMTDVFKEFYMDYSSPEMKKHEFTYTPLGSVAMVFRKEIKGYHRYDVRSHVLGWNQKWLFVISVFERGNKRYAYGVSKYVFKQRSKTVPPESALAHCGYLSEEVHERNRKAQKYLEMSLSLEDCCELFDDKFGTDLQ